MTPPRSASGADKPDALDVALDVVVRWKDHGQYGSREQAVAAMKRRAGVTPSEAERLLELLSTAHDVAVRAVPSHVRSRRFKLHPFASGSDIDDAACRADIRSAVPDLPDAVCDSLLGWVIYWHWMR